MSQGIDNQPEEYDALVEELQLMADNPEQVIKDKRQLIEKYANEMSFKSTYKSIRDYIPDTPEEETTLELALLRTKRKVLLFSLIGIGGAGCAVCKA